MKPAHGLREQFCVLAFAVWDRCMYVCIWRKTYLAVSWIYDLCCGAVLGVGYVLLSCFCVLSSTVMQRVTVQLLLDDKIHAFAHDFA